VKAAVLLLALWLPSCASCVMHPDGTVDAKAFGNAACSVCPRAAPKADAADITPVPIPSPITPSVRDGCLIVQGGSETGAVLTTIVSVILSAATIAVTALK
jgi:hypothetical protein